MPLTPVFGKSRYLFSNEQVALIWIIPSELSGRWEDFDLFYIIPCEEKRREEKHLHYKSGFGFNIIRVRVSNPEGKEQGG